MKRLCALAVLLTSSLASAAGDVVANLEGQYYAGLNFGAGWGGGFIMKPSIVFGYHHDKNSKFELEVLSNINNIASRDRVVGASLLANYRFYPDLDIDPVKLYVSGGLGGYVQILPSFGFGGIGKKVEKPTPPAGGSNNQDSSNTGGSGNDQNGSGNQGNGGTGSNDPAKSEEEGGDAAGAISGTIPGIYGAGGGKQDVGTQTDGGSGKPAGPSIVDKILGSISYKLKVGVDYEITPQIVGAVGITMGGQLSNFKPPIQIPDAVLELGVRYNF